MVDLGGYKGGEMAKECPNCHSKRNWKDGIRETKTGYNQRFICRECSYRFSPKSYKENPANGDRQLCVLQEAKKLDTATEIKTVAGESTTQLPQFTRNLLKEFMEHLVREGYYKDTSYFTLVKNLATTGADLTNPDDVKTKIAQKPWKNSVKMLACYAYGHFCKMRKIECTMPRYRQEEKLASYVPSERDLDDLTSGTQSKRLSTFLQCLKETYADPGEILRLEWKDIKDDVVMINHPVKGHLPGQIKVSSHLIRMLNALPKTSNRVFPATYNSMATSMQNLRKKAANKLQKPQLREISFKSFRHWGGSMLAHLTNGNVLTVKKMLRHKQVTNTMKYIHPLELQIEEDFETAQATTPEEIKTLGSGGWIKYDEMNGIHFYRKSKKFGV